MDILGTLGSILTWGKNVPVGLRRAITLIIPFVGFIQFVIWMIKDWWASLIQQFIDKIDAILGEISISIGWGELNIPWAKINSIIPLTEMISLMITFQAVAVALIVIKWIRNIVIGMT